METLESKIREMNREILRIKTAQPLGSSMKTFYASYRLDYDGDEQLHTYEITYRPSSQPIMTQIYCDTSDGLVLFEPVGDKQIMSDLKTAQIEIERTVMLCSSRQIMGVRKLS